MHHFNDIYPFPAIVGQEKMKLALVLNAINPGIGGVLIKGEKGTAKSTAARALARLLPDREVIEGCRFGCDPHDWNGLCLECQEQFPRIRVTRAKMRVVELPINATEDKVVGSLDIGHALKEGEKKFEPGILAQAHRNILYVDEVNLLNDHIVDVLLDVAAMGMNIVEREGVSYVHPSSFILIGTMNPEEGELRPQLLDRFGLCVDIEGIADADTRTELIRRRMRYERAPASFIHDWEPQEAELRERIVRARALLPDVLVPERMLRLIAKICIGMAVDGHRADITMLRAAATIAAFHGRTEANEEDVRGAADLVLPHRMRRRPFTDQPMDRQKLDETIRRSQESKSRPEEERTPQGNQQSEPDQEVRPDGSGMTQFACESPFPVDRNVLSQQRRTDPLTRTGNGRRSTTESRDGRYVRSRIPEHAGPDIALDATIRAAAPHQIGRSGSLAVKIGPEDIREKVRERKTGTTILFVVDASGSMGAQQRMTGVKGAILSLLIDAYQRRDRVGLVAFRGSGAELLLRPTGSVELAKKYLDALPVGGKTPLAAGLLQGLAVLEHERIVHRHTIPQLVLISDGKGNVGLGFGSPMDDAQVAAARIRDANIPSLVIDSEQNFVSLDLARTLADEMGAQYLRLEDLHADRIAGAVKGIGM